MCLARVDDVIDDRSNGRCFADPGGTAGQNQAVLEVGDFMQRGMEVEFLDRGNMPRKDANGHADPARRGKEVDSKTDTAHGYGIIKGFPLPKHVELSGGHQHSDQVVDFLMRPADVGVKLDRAMRPRHHRMSAGKIDIRHGIFDGIPDDLLELLHKKPPAGEIAD